MYAQQKGIDITGAPFMNIWVVLLGNQPLQGLCGSPDGNRENELTIRGTSVTMPVNEHGLIPDEVAISWRYAIGNRHII